MCMAKNYPFDDPIKYREVFFPEFADHLEVVSAPPQPHEQYNCFAYALGVPEWVRTYTFSQAVSNNDLLEASEPSSNDLVVYFDGTQIRHAGRYFSEKEVISKWAGGPIFRHETFMCPATYGNIVKYFKAVSRDKALWICNQYPVLN